MPQDFFEPRTPVRRERPPRIAVEVDAPPRPPRPAYDEPSWARIYWNTLRSFTRRKLGLRPRDVTVGTSAASGTSATSVTSSAGRSSGRRAYYVAAAVTVAAALTVAAVTLSQPGDSGTRARSGPTGVAADGGAMAGGSRATGGGSAVTAQVTPPEVRDAAAAWVVGNVGPGQVVACDAAVCGALAGLGFPASSTVLVQGGIQGVQSADVVVLTQTLRVRLGAAVDEVTAAEPLAAFGTGSGTATVTAVAHAGRAAYSRTAAAERADRTGAGAELAANKRITFGPGARALLATGQVDMRVCAVLATLSAGHTLTVESFGTAAPGAGPGIPRATVSISAIDRHAATAATIPAVAVRLLIVAQQPPFRPLATQRSGPTLTLRYAQPAPPGTDTTTWRRKSGRS